MLMSTLWIERILLHAHSKITQKGLSKMLQLKDLTVFSQVCLSDEFVSSLSNLELLWLKRGDNIDMATERLPKLKCLDLSYAKFSNTRLSNLPVLVNLSLRHVSNVTDEMFKFMPNLEFLELKNCPITGEGFKYLSKLDYLVINKVDIYENTLTYVPNITVLSLKNCPVTGKYFFHLRQLYSLNLQKNIPVQDIYISSIKTLGCLMFENNTSLTDCCLSHMKNLETLWVNQNITDNGLLNCTKLETLYNFSSKNLTDYGISNLTTLKN